MSPFEHRRTCIDARNNGIGWIKGAVPTGPDTGIEQPTTEALEDQWPQHSVASALERKIQQVVERRDALISGQIVCHPDDLLPQTSGTSAIVFTPAIKKRK
jgi:hypothetical protein